MSERGSKLHIDRLSMRLPPGFGDRAPSIARRVAELLGQAGLSPAVSRESLQVGPVQIGAHDSNEHVARAVSEAIVASLRHQQPIPPTATKPGARHA